MGPSRAMRWRSRSGNDGTVARIIVLPMRPPALVRLLPGSLLLAAACAWPRDGRMPSLEDYSDGTSEYAAALLAGWKSGSIPAALLSPRLQWSGALPGNGLAPVVAGPVLSISVFPSP